ncbi:MAG: hypothetical protein F4206_16910 [Gammaproteobacteria bacterium]|nr:hypothetical protein [Gammaproteobacteria bacterium]MYG68389.1 hypothetical protein [Gammaproteobacteria bacterium]
MIISTSLTLPLSLSLFIVMALAGGPVHAQEPNPAALPAQGESSDKEANSGTTAEFEIEIHPMDRMRTDMTRQLALLNKLSQIAQVLTALANHGPAVLTLLDDSLPYEKRIHAVLERMTPPPSAHTAPAPAPVEIFDDSERRMELEEIRYEIAALRMQIESAGMSEHFGTMPAEPVVADMAAPDWSLSAGDVHYFQLPDPALETSGRVALVAGAETAELDVHETVLFHGKQITLREIASSEDRVLLTFVEDGELTRIRFD